MNLTSKELIHCRKCKQETKNIDSKIVQSSNGLFRIVAKCSICKSNESKFMKVTFEELK